MSNVINFLDGIENAPLGVRHKMVVQQIDNLKERLITETDCRDKLLTLELLQATIHLRNSLQKCIDIRLKFFSLN